jgi:MOB kinase activator 1
VDFFNETSLIYGAISDHCTNSKCPQMSAGSKYSTPPPSLPLLPPRRFEYLWKDNKDYKTPVKKPAPEYIDLLMRWVEEQLNKEELFPLHSNSYPRNFMNKVKNIFRRLFRVYAHLYYSHFQEIVNLGAEAHLNSCFKHFIMFVLEFDLVVPQELEPLKDLIKNLLGHTPDQIRRGGGGSNNR